ncbi:MAG: hypothetical protein A2V66_01610 [Ignavibacteria bacterium RBG_13_36_8]|nr:MAG: hypothetical protein A2V66_01610 [Ignavibacteria bacterium RBG_13_36_8]
MKITVPPGVERDHFWDEPPEGSWEFWAFRWPVKAKVGDTIYFFCSRKLIAKAIIERIDLPGKSSCERTGKYKNSWKVFWKPESFVDMRQQAEFNLNV